MTAGFAAPRFAFASSPTAATTTSASASSPFSSSQRNRSMAKSFQIGDHVSWNSEAGRVSGTIIKVQKKDFDYKGHTHHATPDEPQYEIKSDKTAHIASHKGSALTKIKKAER